MDILDDMGVSKLSAKVFFFKVNYSFNSPTASGKFPYYTCHTWGENALHHTLIKSCQDCSSQASLFKPPQKVQPLVSLFYQAAAVGFPCEVVVYIYPQIFKAEDDFHLHSRNAEGESFLKSTIISLLFFILMQRLLSLHL